MNKYRLRIVLFMAIVSSIALVNSIHPTVKQPDAVNFVFPKSISLPNAELLYSGAVNSYLVQPPAYISGNFISGRYYRYLYHEKYLDIEMRYLTNTSGNLKSFITSKIGELYPALKQNKKGFYSIYADEDKAYLDACIGSRGGSTVTNDQFNRDRLIYDTRFDRFFPWLLGQAELKDRRCIWTHISIALDNNIYLEKTYKDIENIWTDWHTWWRANFPN